jgi:predicted flap endonuclease-1-like 5' DNA nuclease
MPSSRTGSGPLTTFNDSEFKLCQYLHPNRGQHPVIGGAVFANRIPELQMIGAREGGFKIHYGFRGGGEKFLVHVEDIKMAPHLFRAVEMPPQPPPVERQPLAGPIPVDFQGQEIVIDVSDDDNSPPAPKRIDLGQVMGAGREQPREEPISGNGRDLQKLPGVTAKMAANLSRQGVNDLDDILDLGEEGLAELNNIGPQRAKIIFNAAMERAKDVAIA